MSTIANEMSPIDFAKARAFMVEQQVRPWDVIDARVLDVLATVPRDAYVPEAHRALAYADLPLPLGHGEFMMKPVVEGRTLQGLELTPGDEVLEIGTGSGFLSACLGRLARDVLSLELHADLADAARGRLAAQGVGNVRVEHADAFAYTTERRFDAICVTGAVTTIPPLFLSWLKPEGRMFVVLGHSPAMEAVRVRRPIDGDKVNLPRLDSLFETDLPYLVGAAPVPAFQF